MRWREGRYSNIGTPCAQARSCAVPSVHVLYETSRLAVAVVAGGALSCRRALFCVEAAELGVMERELRRHLTGWKVPKERSHIFMDENYRR